MVMKMKFMITPQAHQWYQENLDLKPGDGLHFYGKVYGKTNVHQGFSLAFIKEKPHDEYYSLTNQEITYFFTDNDVWFFKDLDLQIDYDPQTDSPVYTFVAAD